MSASFNASQDIIAFRPKSHERSKKETRSRRERDRVQARLTCTDCDMSARTKHTHRQMECIIDSEAGTRILHAPEIRSSIDGVPWALHHLSVLKRGVPRILAFAFGFWLHPQPRHLKTGWFREEGLRRGHVCGHRVVKRKWLAFKKCIAIAFLQFRGFPQGQSRHSGALRSKKSGVLRLRC